MNGANKIKRVFQSLFIIAVMLLVAACKPTSTVSSSGGSGTPGTVTVGGPGTPGTVTVSGPGIPGTVGAPGAPVIPGTTGTADSPGGPVPGATSIPSTRAGSPSAKPGGKPGGSPSTARSDKGKSAAGSQSTAGTGQDKTDDEILAEALDEFGRKRKPPQPGEGSEGGGGQPPQASAGGGPATSAEKRQVLDKQLQDEFAEFDRLMLSEREAIKKADNQEGYGGFPGEEFAGEGEGDGEAMEEPLKTAMVDSDPASIKGPGNKPAISHSEIPPDLVSAKGDDIIARQLREAAMKEQDPELRAKLWDEYRKYKRDSR